MALKSLPGFLFLLFSLSCFAQEPVSISVSPADVSMPSTVYYVFRDNREFLWFGTSSGVYVYDGAVCKQFTTADGLGDNEILRIYQDKKNRIWFQPVNGIPSYYLNDTIYNPSNSKLLAQLKFNKMILSECEDAAGNFYIGSKDYLYYRVDKNDNVEKLTFSGEENFMWASANNKISFVQHRYFERYHPVRGDMFNHKVMFGVYNQVYEVSHDTVYTKVLELPLTCKEIIFLKMKNEQEIYIGTRNGLYIWDKSSGKPPRHILKGLSVTCVEFDFESNLWVSTLESGIFMIPSLNVNRLSTKNGLPQERITCIEADAAGNLWIGMSHDQYAVLSPEGIISSHQLKKKSTLEISNIRHFGNATWVVAKSGILRLQNEKEKSLNIYGNDVLVHSKGSFFLGLENTVMLNKEQYEQRLDEIVHELVYKQTVYKLIHARTNVIKEDQTGGVWIGTSLGLYHYGSSLSVMAGQNPVFGSPVRDIDFDKSGRFIYIATLNGLLVIRDGKLFTVLDENIGLPNSECNAVHVDDLNNIWSAFGNQLVRIEFKNDTYQFLNYSNALKIECSKISDIDVIASTVYIATENGLIYFNNSGTTVFSTLPLLRLASMQNNEEPVDLHSEKRFSYRENNITISYDAISYFSGRQIAFEYLLEGYDTKWQQATGKELRFNALPPGNYLFHLKAKNKAGMESLPATIEFTILQPFWKTPWFIALGMMTLALITIYIWKNRLRAIRVAYEADHANLLREKEKTEFEKKLSELEQQVFRQQMNPHFMFNALNTIKGYYAENDVQHAGVYITKFSRLLRRILENSQQMISLQAEMEILKLYLELAQMRFENKFTFIIETEEGIATEETGIPPMILQPFVENAILHGLANRDGNGLLSIRFTSNKHSLTCTINDNGIGRKQAAESKTTLHSSISTTVISDYLDALNKKAHEAKYQVEIHDLYHQDGSPAGTSVVITMPLLPFNTKSTT